MKQMTKQELNKIFALHDAGVDNKTISGLVGRGYSTVCKALVKKGKGVKTIGDKNFCINASKDNYDYVSSVAESKGITKHAAMTEIVKLAKRRCLFSWGTK